VCAAAEGIAKFHRVCQVLYNVASLCVRAKKAQRGMDPLRQEDQDMAMVGNNIDMYLSQLGFMPQFGGGGGGQPMPGDAQFGSAEGELPSPGFNAAQGSELGNWFSGNTHILGLLEEDLSEFEPRMWPPMGD
jgi:hypothetical protein